MRIYGDISISELIAKALENERCIDVHLQERFGIENENLPNYKVLHQIGLKRKLGVTYNAFIVTAIVAIPFYNILIIVFILLAKLVLGNSSGNTFSIILSKNTYRDVIDQSKIKNIVDIGGILNLTPLCSWKNIFSSFINTIRLYLLIFGKRGLVTDLVLHSRDSIYLILLGCFARSNPQSRFITDIHYQRWSFILSHVSSNLELIQHGYIDNSIEFPHKFGTINGLYIRSLEFKEIFGGYFNRINETRFIKSNVSLTVSPYSSNAVFIASSFPYIDEELEFVRVLKSRFIGPIMVKLHPVHIYDQRKDELLSFADYVCSKNENPLARVFVSYDSYMKYDYVDSGISCYSLVDGNYSRMVEYIIDEIGSDSY